MAPRNTRSRNSRKNDTEVRLDPKLNALDIAAKKLLASADPAYAERQLLSAKDNRIQEIINSELDLAKGVSNGSIIDFVTTTAKDTARRTGADPEKIDSSTLFTQDVGNIFGYFQDIYKNRYIELNDLKFITKFIPAVGEAVKTTLDQIVSGDDFSTSISRNLEYGANLTAEERAQVEAEIHRIETDEKLLKKLRNITYNKTLVGGDDYVYCIPYRELFEEYDKLAKSGKLKNNQALNRSIARGQMDKSETGFNLKNPNNNPKYANESAYSIDTSNSRFDPAMESIIDSTMESLGDLGITDKSETKKISSTIKDTMMTAFENCFIIDSPVLFEAMEEYEAVMESGYEEVTRNHLQHYRDTFQGNGIISDFTTDGTADLDSKGKSNRPEKFNIPGSYIKFIDAKNLVPVKIFNQIVGYLNAHDMSATKKANSMQNGVNQTNLLGTTNSNLFSSVNMSDNNKQKATQAVVSAVTDGIISNFSSKFINTNAEFKQLIADCIISNGFVNSSFHIQFIPAKYIVHFSVNEDEDGFGRSILQDALFPAKMLLSTLVSKLLLYMNKSGNRTIAYVKRGPIDRTGSNQIQRVIRMLQESNITFSDLLSTNLSFSKFSRYGNLEIPTSRNGDRLIDFETQEGQEVDMSTPMEQYLEKLTILGTGVPSVIMEYTDAADYAKSLVTANLKFAGRVATLQSDLEDPTTDLYKKLLWGSALSDDLKQKVIPQFKFKLCRPNVLRNVNMADYLSQSEQIGRSISNLYMGETDERPDDAKIRREFTKLNTRENLPFVDWDNYEKNLETAKKLIVAEKDLDGASGGTEDMNTGTETGEEEF